eukprot:640332-Prymnesium_polylepis.2
MDGSGEKQSTKGATPGVRVGARVGIAVGVCAATERCASARLRAQLTGIRRVRSPHQPTAQRVLEPRAQLTVLRATGHLDQDGRLRQLPIQQEIRELLDFVVGRRLVSQPHPPRGATPNRVVTAKLAIFGWDK